MSQLWEKFERVVLKYGLAAILLAIPLYPKFPVIDVPGTYVNIRAEDFLISFLTVVFLLSILRRKKLEGFLKDRLTQAIVVFLVVGVLSLLGAIFLTKTIVPHIGFLHWTRRIEYILPLFIAWVTVRRGEDLRFYSQMLIVAILGIFLYALGQIYLNFPVIATQNEEFSKGIALRLTPGARIPSTFAGHYDLAAYLVLIIPLLIALFVFTKERLVKLIYILAIFISYWLLLSSASRISFAAFIIGICAVLFLLRKRFWIVPAVALALFGLLFSQQLGGRYIRTIEIYFSQLIKGINLPRPQIIEPPYMVKSYRVKLAQTLVPSPSPSPKRIRDTLTGKAKISLPEPLIEERSMAIRLNIEWPRAVRAFSKNPILGTGYSSITLATDNDYLRLLGEVGILGISSFLLIFARLWDKLKNVFFGWKQLTFENAFVIGFAAGTLGLLANAAFIDVFEASKVAIIFWTLAGISLASTKK